MLTAALFSTAFVVQWRPQAAPVCRSGVSAVTMFGEFMKKRPGDENNNANPSSSHHHSSAPTRSSRLASSSYSSSNAGTEVRMPGFHAEANNCHPGMTCDKSGMCPIIGIRYHLLGEDYDLCQEEYDKLTEAEKADYEAIDPPVFDAASPTDISPSPSRW